MVSSHSLCNKIWSLVVKYWMRLEKGTDNIFLNNAYECAKLIYPILMLEMPSLDYV